MNQRQSSVPRIALALHQANLLETRHDTGHRGRPNLLGARELTERKRTAEDDNRESGKARRGDPAGVILLAQLPQEMNRRRMELVGKGVRLDNGGKALRSS
jgi:hypothetical protein